MEESDAEDFQEQGGRGTEFRGRVEEEEEEEDMPDPSVFQAPSLPVTCVSLTGTLYKYRFASGTLLHWFVWRTQFVFCVEGLGGKCLCCVAGSRGKCIRTEERWFTPEEFVKQEPTLTDGRWKKDILCHGKTLNLLLKVTNSIVLTKKHEYWFICLFISCVCLSFLERNPAHPFSSVWMCEMQYSGGRRGEKHLYLIYLIISRHHKNNLWY